MESTTTSVRACPRVEIDGVGFHGVTMEEAARLICEMSRERGRARQVCTGNVDHLVLCRDDPEFRAVYEAADLVLPDGAPIVWLSKLGPARARRLPERVAGSDLFWALAKSSAETGLRLFYLGGRPGAAAKAAAVVERRYRGARVVGTYCPPAETFHSAAEQERIRRIVTSAAPDVLLVGLGAPKQEKWICSRKAELGVPVAIGVGASFEMAAGLKRRAPPWVGALGLEWLYRFVQEPRRLFHRYFVRDLPYLLGAVGRAALLRLRAS